MGPDAKTTTSRKRFTFLQLFDLLLFGTFFYTALALGEQPACDAHMPMLGQVNWTYVQHSGWVISTSRWEAPVVAFWAVRDGALSPIGGESSSRTLS